MVCVDPISPLNGAGRPSGGGCPGERSGVVVVGVGGDSGGWLVLGWRKLSPATP